MDDTGTGIRSRRSPDLKIKTRHNVVDGSEEMDFTGEEQPLSPVAKLFLDSSIDCHIVTMIGVGKTLDIEAIKSGLSKTLIRHPRFSSLLVEGKTGTSKWVRTKVVIDDHVIVPPFEPGVELSDELLEEYVHKVTMRSLDRTKPLWEIHLLNAKSKESEATVVLRIHHSFGDGISLMSLFLACTRKLSDADSLPSIPLTKSKVKHNKRCSGFRQVFISIWWVLQMLWNTLVGVFLFTATAFFSLKDSVTPITGSKGVEYRTKHFVHATLSLDDMKVVKNEINGTINDVMLGITSAGLVRYLHRRYEQIATKKGNGKPAIPQNLRVRAAVLFNTRQSPGLHELAEMMAEGNKKVRWGNQLGNVILQVNINKHENPIDHVREAKVICERKKMSLEAIFTYKTGVFLSNLLGVKAAAWILKRMLYNTTFSFSNILGPVEEVEFFGHPIVYIAPTVYGHAHALTVHFQSYVNKVKLVLAVDEETIPDPHQLCFDIEESLKVIKDSIDSQQI